MILWLRCKKPWGSMTPKAFYYLSGFPLNSRLDPTLIICFIMMLTWLDSLLYPFFRWIPHAQNGEHR